jgi:hypothetical protein
MKRFEFVRDDRIGKCSLGIGDFIVQHFDDFIKSAIVCIGCDRRIEDELLFLSIIIVMLL